MAAFTIIFLMELLKYHQMRAAETGHALHVLKTALYRPPKKWRTALSKHRGPTRGPLVITAPPKKWRTAVSKLRGPENDSAHMRSSENSVATGSSTIILRRTLM